MRIAYFAHYFPPAGFAASINTFEIVKRLANRGHRVLVFYQPTFSRYTATSLAHGGSCPMNVELYVSPSTPLLLSVIIPHFLNALKALKYEYDLVITQFHPFHFASYAGFLAKALKRKPWVVKVQDLMLDPSLRPIPEKIFTHLCYGVFLNILGKKADRLLVLTDKLRCHLEKNGYFPDRIAVIPHGVDTRVFSPMTSRKRTTSAKTILYIGSMRPQYGLDCLIKAFAFLKPGSELKLVLVGDGSERAFLMELVKKFGLEGKVVFYRYVPHESIPELIRSAYITVGPLRPSLANYYTIPTKILEYFACGKTTVSSRVCEDILVDAYTGLVLKKITPKSIAEKLSNLIEDEKLTARLGRNARRLVVERFDWEKVMDKLEKELEDVESHYY